MWMIVAGLVALLLVVAGVTVVLVSNHRADVAAAERREAAAEKAAEEKAAKEKAEQEAREKAAQELAAARSTFSDCTDQIGPLLNALKNVDARLDVSVTESQLAGLAGRASVAYNTIDVDQLGTGACLAAGAQLEKALNNYSSTVRQWNDCIFDYGCDVDTIEPSLQAKWLKASSEISRAEHLLDTIDPDSGSYNPNAAGSNT